MFTKIPPINALLKHFLIEYSLFFYFYIYVHPHPELEKCKLFCFYAFDLLLKALLNLII